MVTCTEGRQGTYSRRRGEWGCITKTCQKSHQEIAYVHQGHRRGERLEALSHGYLCVRGKSQVMGPRLFLPHCLMCGNGQIIGLEETSGHCLGSWGVVSFSPISEKGEKDSPYVYIVFKPPIAAVER